MAKLILEYRGERREIPVAGPLTIGRSKSAGVCVEEAILSREHFRVYTDSGRYYVQDLQSKNGTFLNGALLRQPEALKTGDKIKAGPVVFTFYLFEGAEAPVIAAPTPPPMFLPAVLRAAPDPVPAAPPPPPSPSAYARPRTAAVVLYPGSPLDSALRFVLNAALVGVAIVGTFFFKSIFVWIFGILRS